MSVIDGKDVSINLTHGGMRVLPFPLDALSAAADFPYAFFTADADLRVLFAVLPNFVSCRRHTCAILLASTGTRPSRRHPFP